MGAISQNYKKREDKRKVFAFSVKTTRPDKKKKKNFLKNDKFVINEFISNYK